MTLMDEVHKSKFSIYPGATDMTTWLFSIKYFGDLSEFYYKHSKIRVSKTFYILEYSRFTAYINHNLNKKGYVKQKSTSSLIPLGYYLFSYYG